LRELTALAAMIVVAIGILVPVVSKSRERSQRELCQANQGQIGTALAAFSIDNNDMLPSAQAPSRQWLSKSSAASNSSALFQLIARNLARPEAFQCPAAGGQSFVAQAGMIDFPHPKAISYSYQHSLSSAIRRSDAAVASAQHDFAIMADATPVFHNGAFDPVCAQGGTSRNHGNGQNVLYLDGTARWADSCTVGVGGNNIWLAEGVWNYKGDEAPSSPTDTFLLPNPGQ
jgi:competence protein ComGC